VWNSGKTQIVCLLSWAGEAGKIEAKEEFFLKFFGKFIKSGHLCLTLLSKASQSVNFLI
jgi:hypothetical protein